MAKPRCHGIGVGVKIWWISVTFPSGLGSSTVGLARGGARVLAGRGILVGWAQSLVLCQQKTASTDRLSLDEAFQFQLRLAGASPTGNKNYLLTWQREEQPGGRQSMKAPCFSVVPDTRLRGDTTTPKTDLPGVRAKWRLRLLPLNVGGHGQRPGWATTAGLLQLLQVLGLFFHSRSLRNAHTRRQQGVCISTKQPFTQRSSWHLALKARP